LEAGDLILEVNRVKVSSVSQWQQIVDKAPAGSRLLLSCRREDGRTAQDFIVAIQIP
jgi:S1-C subfamily serine protease